MAVRTTISLPDGLKERMDATTENINWSAEAAKCFERLLGELAARKQEKDMNDVIARLKATRFQEEDEDRKAGFIAGQQWAENSASYAELKRAAEFDFSEFDLEANWNAPWNGLDWIAFTICNVDPDQHDDPDDASEVFWAQVLGVDNGSARRAAEKLEESFLEGFFEGAESVWVAVASKL